MAADTIGSLTAVVRATAGQFATDINEIKGSISDLASHFTGIDLAEALGIGAAIEGIRGAMEAAEATVEKFFATFEKAHELENLAAEVGSTAQELSGLQFAAEQGGSSVEVLNTALGKMTQKIGEAREGSEKTSLAFKALGLDANQLASVSAGEALRQIADSISKIPSPADRAAIAVELFGKRGRELVNMLDEGREGINKFVAEGERVGAVLGDQVAKQLSDGSKAIKEMQSAWNGLWNELASSVLPILKSVTNALTEIIKVAKDVGEGLRNVISKLTFGWVSSTADLEAEAKAAQKNAEVHAVAGDNIIKKLKEQEAAQKELQKESEKAAKEAERQAEALSRTIKSALDSARTPLEKFNDTLARTSYWFNSGNISAEQFNTLMSKAADEMERANKEHKQIMERSTEGIAAADINTMAGASLQLSAARNAQDIQANQIEVAQQQLQKQAQMVELLKTISDAKTDQFIATADF